MFDLLWLIPAVPLAGFLVLALVGKRLPFASAIGVATIGISMVLTLCIAAVFISARNNGLSFSQTLWPWLDVAGVHADFTLRLDALSLVMITVVTVVAFLIHLYSTEYIAHYGDQARFFAYMNLFVAAMLVLVLADNLLFLYLGWEGVGLCSYLLIGFWYTDRNNARAAIKAFIVTRVGDTALLIGILLLFASFGTFNIGQIAARIQGFGAASGLCTAAAALILAGAVGKSAQLPLQVWLPDAMAGPTPVSALIHAATMVTAGVYLIARNHAIFEMAPAVMAITAGIGSAGIIIAGLSALVQTNIKRILAYSTISQVGFMFMALGVGAWSAAIFHFAAHAFFKSLLFLAAGVIIMALKERNSIFKMFAARKLRLAFWTYLAGSISISSIPLVDSGFYSKDLILRYDWNFGRFGPMLWIVGVLGAMITAMYSFRSIFIMFRSDDQNTQLEYHPGPAVKIALITLAVFSLVLGFIQLPPTLGHINLFTGFLDKVLPLPQRATSLSTEYVLDSIASILPLVGIYLAYLLFGKPGYSAFFYRRATAAYDLLFEDWYFDRVYEAIFVRPYRRLAIIAGADYLRFIYEPVVQLWREFNYLLTSLQNGLVRWYAACIVIGTIILLAIAVFL
jgi:NADH-quinone oxidoreductase subunit L